MNFRVRVVGGQFRDGRSWTLTDAIARGARLAMNERQRVEVCELRSHPEYGVGVRVELTITPHAGHWSFDNGLSIMEHS